MVRGKKVTIPDGDPGISFSQKTEGASSVILPTHKRIFGKKGSFRTPSVRRSTAMRQRAVSTRSTVYTVQRKWRVAQKSVMMTDPHYEGRQFLCYLNLLLQFLLTYLSIWWAKRQVSTRVVRKMVVCQIIGLIIMGFLFSTGGVFNISLSSKSNSEYTRDFYWAMTIVSMVVFLLSVMGCIGVFRPNMFITQIYAVVSFIFGHLIFSVVLAWYLLVILDAYLSDKYFHDSGILSNGSAHAHDEHRRILLIHPTRMRPMASNNTMPEKDENRLLYYRSDEQIFTDKLLRQYCLMLLFASIIMMSSGVLTTKLLIQVRRKQGYLYVQTTQRTTSIFAQQTMSEEGEPSRERSILNED